MKLETIALGTEAESLPGEVLFRHSGQLRGHHVSVVYALNDREHEYRCASGVTSVESEFTLAALLTAHADDMSPLPTQFDRLAGGPLSDARLVTLWVDP